MKNILCLCAGLILLISGCEEVKKFEVPQLTGRVVDTAAVLSEAEKSDIEKAVLAFEQNTGGQFAVCIVPSMYGETVESASMMVADNWKIGNRDKDDGIIFFLTMTEREFRLEVGYGYEGSINDAKAGDLCRRAVGDFKAQHYGKGIVSIIDGCSLAISGKNAVEKMESDQPSATWFDIWIAPVVVLFWIIILLIRPGGGSFRGGGSFGGGGGFRGGGGSFGGGGASGRF